MATGQRSGIRVDVDRCFDELGRIHPFQERGCCHALATIYGEQATIAFCRDARNIIVAPDARAVDRIVAPHDDLSPLRTLADEVKSTFPDSF